MKIKNEKNKLSGPPLSKVTSNSARFGAGVYEPKKIEQKIYAEWEESGFFNPDVCVQKGVTKKNAPAFSIVLPPPNVTGHLHLGHSAMLAVEDLMIRYQRMRGKRTLWVPGTDHAAIATQTKVEKILKEEGTDRHQLGKEKFLKRVHQFAQDSHDTIIRQTKKIGASLDWSREAYTLDETRTKAVRTVFKMMYDDGLIYRGDRVVNWCPRCHSTLADDEVEYKKQKARLYTFKYSSDFPLTISTTRPETKLGDTAVAVNPKDERYRKYVGQEFQLDFCGVPLKIKIIADRNVDAAFGTGALGVTPAHSMIDWKMAKTNKLAVVKVIDEEGRIRENFGKYSGKNVLEARALVVEELRRRGLLEKEEELENNLSVCYRCQTPIEPIPSLQWFIDVNKKIPRYRKSLKELSLAAVKKGVFGRKKIKIFPQRFEKDYFRWMKNLEDWCISRQIIFGHQIPVWHREKETYVGIDNPSGTDWVQEGDTLDTWFSSGLWTFSTLAQKPEQINLKKGKLEIKSSDFQTYHPTAVMETGYDILFFWVARMILMTTYAVKDIPFQDVYLHGLVRDAEGKKMSKSLGNVIDPLDMIAKYGTDATRLSLVIGTTPGADSNLGEQKIEGFRNFANKLWNIGRYISQSTNSKFQNPKKYSLAEEWILGKLNHVNQAVTKDLENYQFSQAGEKLREFTWNDLADWYVEIHKIEKNDAVINYVFENLLKLWHPFIPFVTEELFREYRTDKNKPLMVTAWPQAKKGKASQGREFEKIISAIVQIRNIRAIYKIDPQQKLQVQFVTRDQKLIGSQKAIIEKLARVEIISISSRDQKPPSSVCIITEKTKIYALLEGVLDLAKEKERLEKESAKLENYITNLEQRLGNKNFVGRAPKEVVEKEKNNLQSAKQKLTETKKYWGNLN